jgi:hypothetical protein
MEPLALMAFHLCFISIFGTYIVKMDLVEMFGAWFDGNLDLYRISEKKSIPKPLLGIVSVKR